MSEPQRAPFGALCKRGNECELSCEHLELTSDARKASAAVVADAAARYKDLTATVKCRTCFQATGERGVRFGAMSDRSRGYGQVPVAQAVPRGGN
jgi:hypothetical protein